MRRLTAAVVYVAVVVDLAVVVEGHVVDKHAVEPATSVVVAAPVAVAPVAVAASSYSGGDFIIPRNVGSPWAAEGSTPHVPQRCVITRVVLGGPGVQVGLAEPVGHLPVSVLCVVIQ